MDGVMLVDLKGWTSSTIEQNYDIDIKHLQTTLPFSNKFQPVHLMLGRQACNQQILKNADLNTYYTETLHIITRSPINPEYTMNKTSIQNLTSYFVMFNTYFKKHYS